MNIKEKILELLKNTNAQYFTLKQLCGMMATKSTLERKIISSALDELAEDCEVVFDEKNRRYRLVTEGDYGKAVFESNARGFGFLICENGEKDLFVPAPKTRGAFNRDKVLYRRVEGTQDEAEVVKILERGTLQLVGTVEKNKHTTFVVPDDKRFISDVYVHKNKDMGAKNGQKAVVKITSFPQDNRNNPSGEVIQVLGYPDEPNVDMLSVAYAFGLSREFPPECEARAKKLSDCVSENDCKDRVDLRDKTVFTIDGADAKDLDDAVSVEVNGDGTYTLGVHIADVSHYVKPDDDVDKEAFKRGTSVYFPQTVFPMLPTALSNGICSLFPEADRLTLTCEMRIDGGGKVLDGNVYESVIRSKRRLTYDAAQSILDGDKAALSEYSDVAESLLAMNDLAKILQRKREKRGNIDFETKEVYFVHNEKGEVVDVVPFERSFSHQLIEEFMIAANETVAEYAEACGYPFVYRVHEKPDEEKLAVLISLMRGVGISVKRSQEIRNSSLQDALKQAKETPYFHLINDVMLRTMQKAKYGALNSGHFGLASKCYCHFTSPIRRYPDLEVHRILKTAITGKMTDKAFAHYEDAVEEVARQSNIREKVADEAERKADDVKKCAYAKTVIGKSFSALISGVTERGIFAELPNTVEGFVSVEKLGGYFEYNKEKFCLYNDSQRYSLGDEINVTVVSVNEAACKIEFSLADQDVDGKGKSVI